MNHLPEPEVTSLEEIERRAGYRSLEPVTRPSYWGVDLAPERRPGVPMMRADPQPMPNSRFPVEPMRGEPAAPKHGRSNKELPPVFGTASPRHGVSGAIKTFAAQYPDHQPRYWLLKLFSDRVESWGYHWKKYLPLALPFAAAAAVARFMQLRGEEPGERVRVDAEYDARVERSRRRRGEAPGIA